MSIARIQDSGGGVLNNRFYTTTVGKYLTLAFLCLLSLSTIGLAISTGILDYRYRLLRNGYQTQSNSLQQCIKVQEGQNTPVLKCGSTYVIKGLYQTAPEEEEEFIKYVKVGIPDLTELEFNDYMSNIPDLRSASIEKYDGEITSSYNTLEVYPDGSLIIGAKDKDGNPTTELEWGLPYTKTSIKSIVSIVGNHGVVIDGIINATGTGIRANSIIANMHGVYVQKNIQSTIGNGVFVVGNVESTDSMSIQVGGDVSANTYGIQVGGDVTSNDAISGSSGIKVIRNVISTSGIGIQVGGDVTSTSGIGVEVNGSVTSDYDTGIYVGGSVTSTLGTGIQVGSVSANTYGIQVDGNVQSQNDFAISVNSIQNSKKGIKVSQTLSVEQQAFVAFEQQQQAQQEVQRQYQQENQQTQQEAQQDQQQTIATLSCTGPNSNISDGCIQINGKISTTAGCGIMVANNITGSGGNATIYVGGDVKLENTPADAQTSSAIYVGGNINSSQYGIYSGAINTTSNSITTNGDITSNSGGAIIVSGSVSSAFSGISITKNLIAGINNTDNNAINAISIGKNQGYPNGNIESPGTPIYVLGDITQTSPINMTNMPSNWNPEGSNNAIYCGGYIQSYGNTISVYGSVSNNLEYNENYPSNQIYPSAIWINKGVKSNYTGVNISSIEAQLQGINVNSVTMKVNAIGTSAIQIGSISSANLVAINVTGDITCQGVDECVNLSTITLDGGFNGVRVQNIAAQNNQTRRYWTGVYVDTISGFNINGASIGSISGGSGGTGVSVGQIKSVDYGVQVNSIIAGNTGVSVSDSINGDVYGIMVEGNVNGDINVGGNVDALSASCVGEITITNGACQTNFYNGQTNITGVNSTYIDIISVSKSYDASIPDEEQQPGYINSITTIGYDIGSINVQSVEGTSYKLGGNVGNESVSNAINIDGSITAQDIGISVDSITATTYGIEVSQSVIGKIFINSATKITVNSAEEINASTITQLDADCVYIINTKTDMSGCGTDFSTESITISGINQNGVIDSIKTGNIQILGIDMNSNSIANISNSYVNIQDIVNNDIGYVSAQSINDLSAQTVEGSIGWLTCSSINTITISNSDAKIDSLTHGNTIINGITSDSIDSISTNNIGNNTMNTAINIAEGVTCGDDGNEDTEYPCIEIGSITSTNGEAINVGNIQASGYHGVYVTDNVIGQMYVGGYVQGSSDPVVYLGGINANNGIGQALQIGDAAFNNDGVSVKGSIDINGKLTVQNANIDAFQVNGITGDYSSGIYVTATNTNDVAISGFRSVGVNIEGDIMAQVDEDGDPLSETAGVSISGGISAYDYAIYVNDADGTITSGSTGIYINVKEITSVDTAVQIEADTIDNTGSDGIPAISIEANSISSDSDTILIVANISSTNGNAIQVGQEDQSDPILYQLNSTSGYGFVLFGDTYSKQGIHIAKSGEQSDGTIVGGNVNGDIKVDNDVNGNINIGGSVSNGISITNDVTSEIYVGGNIIGVNQNNKVSENPVYALQVGGNIQGNVNALNIVGGDLTSLSVTSITDSSSTVGGNVGGTDIEQAIFVAENVQGSIQIDGGVNGNVYVKDDVGLFEAQNVNNVNVKGDIDSAITIGGDIREFLQVDGSIGGSNIAQAVLINGPIQCPDGGSVCVQLGSIESNGVSALQVGDITSENGIGVNIDGNIYTNQNGIQVSGYINSTGGQGSAISVSSDVRSNGYNTVYLGGNVTNTKIIDGSITSIPKAIYIGENVTSNGDGIFVNGDVNVSLNGITVNGDIYTDLLAINTISGALLPQTEEIGAIVINKSVVFGQYYDKAFYNITGLTCFTFTYNSDDLILYNYTYYQESNTPIPVSCQTDISAFGIKSDELISAMLTFTSGEDINEQLAEEPNLIFNSTFMTSNNMAIKFSATDSSGNTLQSIFAYGELTDNTFTNILNVNLDNTQIGLIFLTTNDYSAISIIHGSVSSGGYGIRLPAGNITSASNTALSVGYNITGDIKVNNNVNGNINIAGNITNKNEAGQSLFIGGSVVGDVVVESGINGGITVQSGDVGGQIYIGGSVTKSGVSIYGSVTGEIYVQDDVNDNINIGGNVGIIQNTEAGETPVYALQVGGNIQGNVNSLNIVGGDLTSLSVTNTLINQDDPSSTVGGNVGGADIDQAIFVAGNVQGNGDAIVQIGSIINNGDGVGQALSVGTITGDVVVETSVDGQIVVQGGDVTGQINIGGSVSDGIAVNSDVIGQISVGRNIIYNEMSGALIVGGYVQGSGAEYNAVVQLGGIKSNNESGQALQIGNTKLDGGVSVQGSIEIEGDVQGDISVSTVSESIDVQSIGTLEVDTVTTINIGERVGSIKAGDIEINGITTGPITDETTVIDSSGIVSIKAGDILQINNIGVNSTNNVITGSNIDSISTNSIGGDNIPTAINIGGDVKCGGNTNTDPSACVSIGGQVNVQNANIDGIQVGSITGCKTGVNITGDISNVQQGVNVTGKITASEYGVGVKSITSNDIGIKAGNINGNTCGINVNTVTSTSDAGILVSNAVRSTSGVGILVNNAVSGDECGIKAGSVTADSGTGIKVFGTISGGSLGIHTKDITVEAGTGIGVDGNIIVTTGRGIQVNGYVQGNGRNNAVVQLGGIENTGTGQALQIGNSALADGSSVKGSIQIDGDVKCEGNTNTDSSPCVNIGGQINVQNPDIDGILVGSIKCVKTGVNITGDINASEYGVYVGGDVSGAQYGVGVKSITSINTGIQATGDVSGGEYGIKASSVASTAGTGIYAETVESTLGTGILVGNTVSGGTYGIQASSVESTAGTGIYVENTVTSTSGTGINVVGQVKGSGSSASVVQLGGINANDGLGQALSIKNTALSGVSVEGSIQIEGNIILNSDTQSALTINGEIFIPPDSSGIYDIELSQGADIYNGGDICSSPS